jgi:Fe-S cluster assembly ATP-binding protein
MLEIKDLKAGAEGRDILKGVTLTVKPGEVHAIMGPNGSGKSTLAHVLMGRPGYEVTGGSVTIDGVELLGMPTWQRANAGLFLAMQYPVEVPGVALDEALREAFSAAGRDAGEVADLLVKEADRVGLDPKLLSRAINVDFSGGEKKTSETVQLAVIRPLFAVLDEIDSGLDLDLLRAVSRRIEAQTSEDNLGVLAITHYNRLLHELRPDTVHVLVQGRIVTSGGPDLPEELERTGYAAYGEEETAIRAADLLADPFADPLR